MLKAEFIYRFKTIDTPIMNAKFAESASAQFESPEGVANNIGMEFAERMEGSETVINLSIYYKDRADYESRTAFERAQTRWLEIWFNANETTFVREALNIYVITRQFRNF
ncbi:hypothetical protein EQG49_07475 [Periweissella cryptocerci]|uniref:Uncharacterized protein n=1 Tax=Periweissella cryptocerci TaxID=2506420 RepID=A0A4P6YUE2_9LACO|nr:hypothetical protein [Periweissella cryptocerci]QBO36307.1 hypothetical protein EQG49_07475 [Periweissella cryptocerci]